MAQKYHSSIKNTLHVMQAIKYTS